MSRVEQYIEFVESTGETIVRVRHEGSHPYFTIKRKIGNEKEAKTRRWNVVNKRTREIVGVVKWYGGWRKYVFHAGHPAMTEPEDTWFDSDCLKMIAEFLEEKNGEHRAILKRRAPSTMASEHSS